MMFKRITLNIFFIVGLLFFISPKVIAQSESLKKGDTAPKFNTEGSLAGKEFNFSLEKALSKGSVVLYFFPSAYTGGCDLEAHTFSELHHKFEKANATIIGVSADDLTRLNKFSADPDFCAGKFPVVSDPKGKIAAKYGLKISAIKKGAKDLRGAAINHGFIPRTTFVIDQNNKIIAVFSSKIDQLSPDEHVTKSLSIVENM